MSMEKRGVLADENAEPVAEKAAKAVLPPALAALPGKPFEPAKSVCGDDAFSKMAEKAAGG